MKHTGELSKLFEIDRTTLNYYVKKGLVHPHKEENQYHAYSFSDSMALAYLRHYLGLGFRTEEIPALFGEGTAESQLSLVQERLGELAQEERRLKLRRFLLKNLEEAFSFILSHPGTIEEVETEPYYFIPKQDIPEDSLWMYIFKMVPSLQFQFSWKKGEDILLPDLESSSGISLKASWLDELSLSPPEGAIYYPPQKEHVGSFPLRGDHLAEDLTGHLHNLSEFFSPSLDGHAECILYLFLSRYGEGVETLFESVCFFSAS